MIFGKLTQIRPLVNPSVFKIFWLFAKSFGIISCKLCLYRLTPNYFIMKPVSIGYIVFLGHAVKVQWTEQMPGCIDFSENIRYNVNRLISVLPIQLGLHAARTHTLTLKTHSIRLTAGTERDHTCHQLIVATACHPRRRNRSFASLTTGLGHITSCKLAAFGHVIGVDHCATSAWRTDALS